MAGGGLLRKAALRLLAKVKGSYTGKYLRWFRLTLDKKVSNMKQEKDWKKLEIDVLTFSSILYGALLRKKI